MTNQNDVLAEKMRAVLIDEPDWTATVKILVKKIAVADSLTRRAGGMAASGDNISRLARKHVWFEVLEDGRIKFH